MAGSPHDAWVVLLAVATLVDGLLAGASLDQSIEQLPARHRIGTAAYSAYSRAAHLGRGRFWLIPLGLGGAALTIAAGVWGLTFGLSADGALPLAAGIALAVAHTVSTAVAAPLNASQWRPGTDVATVAAILDGFERRQAVRAALQFLTFAAAVWALLLNGGAPG